MAKILVTGGTGYIGSHTVYALIEKGEDVVIVDNLQTGFKQLIHPKAKFYQGDLRDKEFLNSVFEKEDKTVRIGGNISNELRNAIKSLGFAVL